MLKLHKTQENGIEISELLSAFTGTATECHAEPSRDASLAHKSVWFLQNCVKPESKFCLLAQLLSLCGGVWESTRWIPKEPDLIKPALSRVFD